MTRCLGLAVLAIACSFARLAAAGPIEDLEPGAWYEVPESRLDAVAGPHPGIGDISCVMSCWAGGAFDTTRDRLYVTGGGHNGYSGNEIYAFDMNDLAWIRLNDFTPTEPGGECPDPEVAPCATHTYDGMEYIPPPVDRLVVAGCCMPHAYLFDPESLVWEVVDLPSDVGNTIGNVSGYDPMTQRFLFETTYSGQLYAYDAAQNAWNVLAAGPYLNYYRSGALDPTRRLFVLAGSGNGEFPETADSLLLWNVDDATWSAVATTGDTTVASLPSPGLDYDAVADRMVAWAGGGDVYSLDLDTLEWEAHATTGEVIPTAANMNGTFGRFRYVPSKNVFVAVNNTNENVFVFRFSPGAGTGSESGDGTGADGSGSASADSGSDASASASASDGSSGSAGGNLEGTSAAEGPTATGEQEGESSETGGCGCSNASGAPAHAPLLVVLAALRRRVRSSVRPSRRS
jgi:hypothetical protein